VKLIVEVVEPYHGMMGEATQELVAAVVMNDGFAVTAPRRVMRSASHRGTWPPCNGRSALPAL
jgi:hypothetical protein